MIPLAERWEAGVNEVIRSRGVPWHVTRLGARAEYHFLPTPPRDGAEQVAHADHAPRAVPPPRGDEPRRADDAVPQHGADEPGDDGRRRRSPHRGLRRGRSPRSSLLDGPSGASGRCVRLPCPPSWPRYRRGPDREHRWGGRTLSITIRAVGQAGRRGATRRVPNAAALLVDIDEWLPTATARRPARPRPGRTDARRRARGPAPSGRPPDPDRGVRRRRGRRRPR